MILVYFSEQVDGKSFDNAEIHQSALRKEVTESYFQRGREHHQMTRAAPDDKRKVG